MFYIFRRWEQIPNWKNPAFKGWKYKFKLASGRDLSPQDLRNVLTNRIRKHGARSGLWNVVIATQSGFQGAEGGRRIELGWVC